MAPREATPEAKGNPVPEPHDPAAKDYTDREIRHLRELLQAEIRDLRQLLLAEMRKGDEANAASILAAEKAVQLALEEQRAWRAGANEWRASFNDFSIRTMPRSEIEGKFTNTEKDIDQLKAFMHTQQGSKVALASAIGILLGVIGAGLAIYNTIRIPK